MIAGIGSHYVDGALAGPLADTGMSSEPTAPSAPIPLRPLESPSAPPGGSVLRVAGNLPRPLTSLIGREADVAAILALLGDGGVRLLTLTGPGGVGKTRLALRAGEEASAAFPDGVVFVPLAAIGDPELVLPAIARALGVRAPSSRTAVELIAGELRDARLLLVLDNFEQVRPAATQLAMLLGACAGLSILVTSRAMLRVAGEQRFPFAPLALPALPAASAGRSADVPLAAIAASPAVQLFVARAQAVDPNLRLDTETAPEIAAICQQLDGLPLAIELAAARSHHLAPAGLLGRLGPAVPLLTGGPDDAPHRLRTMRDAIAWSYNLLSPEEQVLFRRLAVFEGGFTVDAAEAVTEGAPASPSVLDLIASLIDKSLVRRTEAAGTTRFGMLETIRESALERLAESGEAAAIRAAHAAAMVDLAERAEPHLLGPEERQWEIRVETELANLRAALAWALEHDVALALRIAAPLWVYWSVNHLPEGRRWLQAALAQPSPADDLLRARALTTEGALACLLGDFAAGETAGRAAVALAEAADDPIVEARARWIVGASRLSAGQLDGVAHELDRALTLFARATTSADRTRSAFTRATRAMLAFTLGEVEQGIDDSERALADVREVGSDGVTIFILSNFGGQLVVLGETSRARVMFEEALSLVVDYPGFHLTGQTLFGLALIAAREGAAATAARRLGAAEAMAVRNGLVLPAYLRDRIDRVNALAKEALGEEPFAVAWDAGRANPDLVITEALGDRDVSAVAKGGGSVAAASGLTARERDVLRLLVRGWSDKEIAAELGISRRTVSNHLAVIRDKLGTPSRSAAVAIAVRDRLV